MTRIEEIEARLEAAERSHTRDSHTELSLKNLRALLPIVKAAMRLAEHQASCDAFWCTGYSKEHEAAINEWAACKDTLYAACRAFREANTPPTALERTSRDGNTTAP